MKVRYDKDEDILMIELERGKIDDAYETDSMIVHVDIKQKPLLLEIFNASEFFAAEGKILPDEVKEKYFSA